MYFLNSFISLAPEVFLTQLDQALGYSFAADWWSLGVLAYELLCGQRPFNIHSVTPLDEVLAMQRADALTFPTHVTPPFSSVVQKLLVAEPDKRISNLDGLKKCPALADIDFEALVKKEVRCMHL